jgi:hypothetical protein
MGLNTQRTTLNAKHSFDQVALVATAFLFILGFVFPPTIPWQLAALSLISSLMYALVRKLLRSQPVRELPAGASSRAHRSGGERQRSR